MAVYRVYTEKKAPFAVEAQALLREIREVLLIPSVTGVRLLNRYDIEGVGEALFEKCLPIVFFEPQLDEHFFALPQGGAQVVAVEYLPGQFDARAASCEECVQLVSQGERPTVRTARVYMIAGAPGEAELARIRRHLINPVECREADLAEKATLQMTAEPPEDVPVLDGFTQMDESAAAQFVRQYGLAMDEADLLFCRDYFRGEQRDPTLTEVRMLDTYWSDHCRHTTFLTTLTDVTIEQPAVKAAYARYLALRGELGRADRPVNLMDIATIGAKALKARGKLESLDESDEVNACSIRVTAEVDGKPEPWLVMFKNETHNHPTEIEPFGGAATCLGGAIRDPLSGRAYVYQAMRVTGAADPLAPVSSTLPGKLPQRKLTTTAAAGYSAYGNQIGLATGLVDELYHPGYAAKRLEIGAVIGAAPLSHVRREEPAPGDVVLLLGGRTGRDGCGGATGSSKSHTQASIETCGAEVQKGNPVVERKIQRLFRNPEVTRLIKRCNDFGAGGVSVAIGELADGLDINLDHVPKKYEGLGGTELAISESQERMAVVVAAEDAARFIQLSGEENLEATQVAVVTAEPRLTMRWRGKPIVDIRRSFLNTNGAEKRTAVLVKADAADARGATALPAMDGMTGGAAGVPVNGMAGSAAGVPMSGMAGDATGVPMGGMAGSAAGVPMNGMAGDATGIPTAAPFAARLTALAGSLACCSRQGLSERFDSTIGAGTVLMPFGGARQLTPAQAMAAKLPVLTGDTATVSGMAYGYHPELMERSPYEGAYLSVAQSLARLAASGFDARGAYLTFQEYFPRTGGDPARWGAPLGALLGALDAQLAFGTAAIGGKDSMSGTFEGMDVPPTLVSFAVAMGTAAQVTSPEFKAAGSRLYYLHADPFDSQAFMAMLALLYRLTAEGKVAAAWATGLGGVAEGLFKMALGNGIGARVADGFTRDLFAQGVGGVIVEAVPGAPDTRLAAAGELLGETTAEYAVTYRGARADMAQVQAAYENKLEPVFPRRAQDTPRGEAVPMPETRAAQWPKPALRTARPIAVIPAFPGTNCEVDTARALTRAGAEPRIVLVRNLTAEDIHRSVEQMREAISGAQMLVFPGGFSGGDEPDGSGKFITAFFRNPAVADATDALLRTRDGLVLGICNGFQALVKLGLLPFGRILDTDEACPTLTYNRIGRHQSMLVRTRVMSNKSPWLQKCAVGDVHTVAVSHGEGRFVCGDALLHELAQSGQIATQYVDLGGLAGMDERVNPNGSVWAVEGITSPDGRVLGKMGHSERSGQGLYRNIPGELFQPLFEGGVEYFK